jgi:conjugative relaxase-like TrwC/TraI family protein
MNITPINKKDYYMRENIKDENTRDYYKKSENDIESIGIAKGYLADKFKIEGKDISLKEYNRLLGGYNPNDGQKLLKNAGDKNQKFGYDITFSAPKDFSIVFALADDTHKNELNQAFDVAVEKAMDRVQDLLQYRNQSQGRTKYEQSRGGMYVQFNQFSSRENDPQKHAHCLIPNFVQGKDGGFYAVETKQLYQNHKSAEVIFQLELGKEIEKLGYTLEKGNSFNMNIKGIAPNVRSHYSKRSEQIGKYRKAHKDASIQDSKLNTRSKKSELSAEENFKNWKDELSGSFGLDALSLEKMKNLPVEQKPQLTSKQLLQLTCEYIKKPEFTSKDVDNALVIANNFFTVGDKSKLRRELFNDKSVVKESHKRNGNQIYFNKGFVGKEYLKQYEKTRSVRSRVNLNVTKAKLNFDNSSQDKKFGSDKKKEEKSKGAPVQQIKLGSNVAELSINIQSISSSLMDLSARLLEAKGDEFHEIYAQVIALQAQLAQAFDRLGEEEQKELNERTGVERD